MKGFRTRHAAALGLMLFLWTVYLCDQEMARYGIYTLFPYSVHEALSVIPLALTLCTLVWLLVTLVSAIRRKALAQHALLLVLLAVCLFAQSYHLTERSHRVSVTGIAAIQSLNPEMLEAVAVKQDGSTVTLEIPMLLSRMLRTDGTTYMLSYEYDPRDPSRGVLCMARDTAIP